MRAKTATNACVLVALALLLAGCGGGGRSMTAQVTPASTFLGDQATLVTLNMEWLPVLFPGFFSVGGGGSPTEPVIEYAPDGTMTETYTDSDGTQETWVIPADYSTMSARLVHPDVGVETQAWNLVFHDDGSVDATEAASYAGGGHLERSFHAPADDGSGADHLYNSQTGKFTLANGEVLDFKEWEYGIHFVLQVDGHEGWTYDLSAPSKPGHEWVDPSRAATGTFTRATQVTSFTLPANPGGTKWQNMTLTAPGGITGTYALAQVLTGTGTVMHSGQLFISILWGSDGKVTATFADGHNEVGEPSAAARDFLIDKWLWDLGSFGPNPR
jgi:hypothetical protein